MRGTYICEPAACTELNHGVYARMEWGTCWHESAARRLAWEYGDQRANRIALGIGAATIRDLAAWNGRGTRKRAAA